jgi:hypothetical protein
MPPWLARHDAPARGQRVMAMATRVREDVNPLLHTLDWDEGRQWPGWPGWPPGLRRLFLRRPRSRWRPAKPSDDGGFEDVVEFCWRSASCRSKSAICFLASFNSRRSRSTSASSCSMACCRLPPGSDPSSRGVERPLFDRFVRRPFIPHTVRRARGFVQPLNCYAAAERPLMFPIVPASRWAHEGGRSRSRRQVPRARSDAKDVGDARTTP